jgi:hypothetical protein
MAKKTSLLALWLAALLGSPVSGQPGETVTVKAETLKAEAPWTAVGLLKGGLRSLTSGVRPASGAAERPKSPNVIAGIRA